MPWQGDGPGVVCTCVTPLPLPPSCVSSPCRPQGACRHQQQQQQRSTSWTSRQPISGRLYLPSYGCHVTSL